MAPDEKELAEEQTAPPLTPEEAKEEAKLEEEAEEERELEPEPDVTVYVKVLVQGGVPSDAEGKPKLENPEFVLMGTTYEVFAKHGNSWAAMEEENGWSRPLVGMFSVALLNEILKEGEVEYNAIEDNELTWGNDWDQIREALADNPAPFNKYAVFHIKWRPEDLTWEEPAKKAYDIYNYRYTKEELIAYRKRELQVIAKIKGLSTSGDEGELVDRIVAFVPGAEEEIEQLQPIWKRGMPLTDEQIEQVKMDAVHHIANLWVVQTALLHYDKEGRESAVKAIKENLSNGGWSGPGEPDVMGTSKGIWVMSEIMTPTEAEHASPTIARLITYGDMLDFILANRAMFERQIKEIVKKEEVPSVVAAEISPSEADLLAQEALKEIAEDALRELRGL